jgi:prepilin-type N-terminal cleavage/methylation domain-containing protein
MKKHTQGFTLIELLVVIAIVAILSVVVILTLNPAELLRQSRDSNRISDMSTLRSALSLYLTDQTTIALAGGTYTANCYVSTASTTNIGVGCQPSSSGATKRFYPSGSAAVTSSTTPRNINGTGWVGSTGAAQGPNFTLITSGTPIGQLPVDPTAASNVYYYGYGANTASSTFKISAHMESTKYKNGGGATDIESTDGGVDANSYEIGTDLTF